MDYYYNNDSAYGDGLGAPRRRFLNKKCSTYAAKKKPEYWRNYKDGKKKDCILYQTHIDAYRSTQKNKAKSKSGSKSAKFVATTKSGAPLFPSNKKNVLISKSGAEYIKNKKGIWVSKSKMRQGLILARDYGFKK